MSLIGKTKLRILQTLAEEPTHGYQLHQELELSTATVYQHLDELEEAGMVEHEFDEAADGRERKCYRLTPDGESLLELLGEE